MKGYKTYLVIFLLLFFSNAFFAEEHKVALSEKQWEEVTEGVDFTEDFKENNPEELDIPKPLDYNLSGFKYVFYFLVIGLVIFLIIKIIINYNSNPSLSKNTISIDSIEEIEDKMHEIDLDKLLEEAIKAKNYRIALRINFLIIIKMLSQKNEIIWAKEKTNWEYYEEVSDLKTKDLFKGIITSFEPVWYGEHLLSEEQFNALSPSYEQLKKQLAPHE